MGGNKLLGGWKTPATTDPPMSDPAPTLMRGLLEAFILESLETAPKHGYALLKEMEIVFGEEPNRNKMYPLLARLEQRLLVRSFEEEDERGRTTYALTDAGRAELETYRRVPLAFRHTLLRLWPAPAGTPAPVSESAPIPLAARPALAVALPSPLRAPSTLPYPCPDARLHVDKDPRTGDLSIELTACPMGAFDYCPQCPMFQAVAGVRKLVLG